VLIQFRRILLFSLALLICSAPVANRLMGMQCLSSGKTHWKINSHFNCCTSDFNSKTTVRSKCCEFYTFHLKYDKGMAHAFLKFFLDFNHANPLPDKLLFILYKPLNGWSNNPSPPLFNENILSLLMRYNL